MVCSITEDPAKWSWGCVYILSYQGNSLKHTGYFDIVRTDWSAGQPLERSYDEAVTCCRSRATHCQIDNLLQAIIEAAYFQAVSTWTVLFEDACQGRPKVPLMVLTQLPVLCFLAALRFQKNHSLHPSGYASLVAPQMPSHTCPLATTRAGVTTGKSR